MEPTDVVARLHRRSDNASKALAVPTWIFCQIFGSVGNMARDGTGYGNTDAYCEANRLVLDGLTVALAGKPDRTVSQR
jgi:hypothetical protein